MSWVNRAEEIYIKELGKDVYEERKRSQFQPPPQWFPKADLVTRTSLMSAFFVAATIGKRGRVPHPVGIGLKGHAQVVRNSGLHADSYFLPNKILTLHVRLSSPTDDDRDVGFKAMAIKLTDDEGGAPVDFITETGEFAPLFNLDVMLQFIKAKMGGRDAVKQWLLEKPNTLSAICDGYRSCPESFSDLKYFAQMTFLHKSSDGTSKLMRFRVVPWDGRQETGLLSDEQQYSIWDTSSSVFADETKSKTYLRDEIVQCVEADQVQFRFQYQKHDIDEESSEDAYNPAIAWSDVTSPWRDVMIFTLTSPLSIDETRRLAFNVTNLPDSLGFPEATSRFSPASVPYARGMAYSACEAVRKWMDW